MKKYVKLLGILAAVGMGVFLLIQLIPYGHNHTNPPVVQEPAWDSTQTRALAQAACFDCHSNETVWPWYSNIAPVSWLVMNDVEEGRSNLNFSDWPLAPGEGAQFAEEIIGEVQREKMPPFQYTLIHPLSTADRVKLIEGLRLSLK
ncbi:MAG TPA: heme-binding domain-containing protein [Anaerolineaceae bacterium]|nr:heme-binding domain-containing protein [Anaerolineaceae bacterium]HPN53367.1 heme-binding domain-containing protein [Anaerolineaceae bacterium]